MLVTSAGGETELPFPILREPRLRPRSSFINPVCRSAPVRPGTCRDGDPVKALVVEDHEGLREVVASLLRERGHEVHAFADAESAWEAAQATWFPIAMLDWGLPAMDGLALCRLLRSQPRGAQRAIVVVTGRSSEEDLAEVIGAGASDYLTKPFHYDQLVARAAFAERQVEVDAARETAEATLQLHSERFRSLVQNCSDIIAVLDADGNRTYISPSVRDILGYEPQAMLGVNVCADNTRSEHERKLTMLLMEQAKRHPGENLHSTTWIRRADGTPRLFELTVTNLLGDPNVNGIVFNSRDVTDRHVAELSREQSEERYRELYVEAQRQASELRLLDRVRAAIAREMELPELFRTVVDAISQVLGYTLVSIYLIENDELVLQHYSDDYPQVLDHIPMTRGVMARVARTGVPALLSRIDHDPDFIGAFDGISSEVCVPLRDDGRVAGVLNLEATGEYQFRERDLELMLALAQHIDSAIGRTRLYQRLRASEERYRHLALHDPLTGLPNRTMFAEQVESELTRAGHPRLAIGFLDLDGFKLVNDSLGHDAGDHLLQHVAKRLVAAVRGNDVVARLGGDEFAIMFPGLGDGTEVGPIASRVMEVLARPFTVDGVEVAVSASIGVAIDSGTMTSHGDLLRRADIALYEAKGDGRNRYRVYEPWMSAAVFAKLQRESDLRRAIDEGELRLHYQPTFDLRTGSIAAVEALVRWHHPQLGMLAPAEFLKAVDASGLIVPLGRWVLEEGCRQGRRWQDLAPGRAPRVTINLSVRELHEPAFVELVAETLRQSGLRASQLELEIAENVMLEAPVVAPEVLEALRALGVRIAVDDFGSGHASLSHLREIRAHAIKIDRTLVDGVARDRSTLAVLKAINGLAIDLGLDVAAEGIETAEQLSGVRAAGIDFGQGFYFSRPIDAGGVDELIADEPRVTTALFGDRVIRASA